MIHFYWFYSFCHKQITTCHTDNQRSWVCCRPQFNSWPWLSTVASERTILFGKNEQNGFSVLKRAWGTLLANICLRSTVRSLVFDPVALFNLQPPISRTYNLPTSNESLVRGGENHTVCQELKAVSSWLISVYFKMHITHSRSKKKKKKS